MFILRKFRILEYRFKKVKYGFPIWLTEELRKAFESEGWTFLSVIAFYGDSEAKMKEKLEERRESYEPFCSCVRYMEVDPEDEIYELFKPNFGNKPVVYEFFGLERKVEDL